MPEEIPLSGPEALEALAEKLASFAGSTNRMPSFHASRVVPHVSPLATQLKADLPRLLTVYQAPFSTQLADAVATLPLVLRGFNFATSQLQAEDDPSEFDKNVVEGTDLRVRAFNGLDQLLTLRRVKPGRVKEIKQGRGYVDLADDLQVCAPLLRDNWSVLEKLQADQTDPDLILTAEHIARMVELGDIILERLHQKDTPDSHWRRMVIRTAALLDQTWETIRTFAPTAYKAFQQSERAAGFITLAGMHRS